MENFHLSKLLYFFLQLIASKVKELSPKTTELIYELIANIGVRSVTDIANLIKKMNEKDYHLIFNQIKGIYDFVENDIEALRNSQEVFKIVPGGYLNINSRVLSVSLHRRKKVIFFRGGSVKPCGGEHGIYTSRGLINLVLV